jgi:large subunit ribosomal protein L18e
MTISKTKVNSRMRIKTNTSLAEAIFIAKKKGLIELAAKISAPSRSLASVNLDKLNNLKGNTAIIAGKVLSTGEITKKIKVYALNFSEKAEEKLKKAGCEFKTILEALKKGDKLEGEFVQ